MEMATTARRAGYFNDADRSFYQAFDKHMDVKMLPKGGK